MDITDLLAGGGLVAAGMVLQKILPRRRGPKFTRPICGCKHNRSFHEDGTGRCSHESAWTDPCTCRKYVGPEPLPELYSGGYTSE